MKIKYNTFIVKDMDESISFYTDVMGFRVDSEHNPHLGVKIVLLKGEGDTMIELIQNTENEPGLYCIGMEVEDVKATVDELKNKGVKIVVEPIPITVGYLAFIEDPNGARIALIQHN